MNVKQSYIDRLIDEILSLSEEERKQFTSRLQQVVKTTSYTCEDLVKAFSNFTQQQNECKN